MRFALRHFLLLSGCYGFACLASADRLAAAETPGAVWTQAPQVEPSQLTVAAQQGAGAVDDRQVLAGGPAANWIWNVEGTDQANFRKKFSSAGGEGFCIATCDNQMVVKLNGRQIANSSNWQTPILSPVQLLQGENVIEVEANNESGPAGFALKLASPAAGGKWDYVVTDASWERLPQRDAKDGAAVRVIAPMGSAPWGEVFAQPGAARPAPGAGFHLLPGFQVEQLFTVPGEQAGSWVAMTFDNKGRIIASDQGGKGLYRITPPAIGSSEPTKVEKLDTKMTGAQGLLYAFDSLYAVANGGPGSGLYRLRDTNGDDQFDEMVKLKEFHGGGEHGPHAIRLAPDGKSLYVIAGNHTKAPDALNASRITTNWGEDLLLPRQWDARGHAVGILAPGGWIAQTDPDGKSWEMVSIGYRNPYDMAFNADGELFAYDADMEWDMGMPWYRPTRVVHATSGSEFGWRSGAGKWPAYYVDSLPPMVDIGPGSPVGVEFGAGAKFPAKYQRALYILDWTFGTMYALHLKPEGASYTAEKEEFLSRTPLPLTDAAVGPDGALYFTIGGRNSQSALYRVIYVGDESTAPVDGKDVEGADERAARRQLEAYHTKAENPAQAIDFAWPYLNSPDRFLRFAARTAIEHQDVALWQDRALAEKNPIAATMALTALARHGDKALEPQLLAALERFDLAQLPVERQLDFLRVYQLVLTRMGQPDDATAARLATRLDALYPNKSDAVNRELCILLVYLKSPTVVAKTLEMLRKPTETKAADLSALLARNGGYGGPIAQMLANMPELEKIHLAYCLRNLRYGWTLEQRKEYFAWLDAARSKRGGASYEGFLANIRKDALANASEAEQAAIASAAPVKPLATHELPKPIGPGRDWNVSDIVAAVEKGLHGRDFEKGKRTFAAAQCVSCHRFDGHGGATGPDLTNLAGRFSTRDLAESIIEPSKTISDQYQASVLITVGGKVYNGRLLSEDDKKVTMLIDPVDVDKTVEVARDDIEELMPSKNSLMPQDLLKPLNQDEVLDLFAYLLSRGNPQDPMFRAK